jgi:RNA polymerase sigma-70 factor (ECF subfamily)
VGQEAVAVAAPAKRRNDRVRALVERAQRGDRRALEDLYVLHFDRIYGYLHMSVGSRHDAEDLTTQTFVRMLEAIGRFRWRSAPFSAWLLRIAHNLAIDHFRANRRWQPEERIPESEQDEESSAEEQALASLGETRVLTLIERLSPEQRQVLTLKFVYRFSNGEAATILGKTEGAVKALQHRALASLERHVTR